MNSEELEFCLKEMYEFLREHQDWPVIMFEEDKEEDRFQLIAAREDGTREAFDIPEEELYVAVHIAFISSFIPNNVYKACMEPGVYIRTEK